MKETIKLIGKNGAYEFNLKDTLNANGRFGSTFLGKNIVSGEQVIVKLFNSKRAGNTGEFRFKSDALYVFGRKDIQDSVDFISEKRGVFIIKKYIPGTSLKELNPKKITLPQLKEALLNISDTLDYTHSRGIVHADIKPANIIWPGTSGPFPEKPVLIDFGLARWDKFSYKDSLYSFIYGAPEQVLGMTDFIGPWTDLFSLGVVTYEILTEEQAYDFEEQEGFPVLLEQAQISMPLQPDSKIPADWYAFISKVCSKPQFKKPPTKYTPAERWEIMRLNIEQRPQNAEDFKRMVMNLSTENKKVLKWKFWE